MNRTEFIRRLVLNEISDDYENLDQIILPNIAKVLVKFGWNVERTEIVEALTSLVNGGFAKAYTFSSFEPNPIEIDGMPEIGVPEADLKTYFWITPKGKNLHLSDDAWWPFDEYGNPLWPAPEP